MIWQDNTQQVEFNFIPSRHNLRILTKLLTTSMLGEAKTKSIKMDLV